MRKIIGQFPLFFLIGVIFLSAITTVVAGKYLGFSDEAGNVQWGQISGSILKQSDLQNYIQDIKGILIGSNTLNPIEISPNNTFLANPFSLNVLSPLLYSKNNTLSMYEASATQSGYLSSSNWILFNGKESTLTFKDGLNRSSNDIYNTLITGKSGGQSINGGTESSDNLTINSTNNDTKGNIFLNPNGGKVGIGTTDPMVTLHNNGDFITKGPTYDVRAFGAKGNGTDDDQSAIEEAISYANSNGGGLVFLPPGTYKITKTIHLKSNVTLKGSGIGSTIITSGDLPPDDGSGQTYTTNTQIRAKNVNNTSVRDLTLKLENSTLETREVGISFDEVSTNGFVTNVETIGHEKPALRVTPGAENVWFVNNYVHDTVDRGTGILVDAFDSRTIRGIFILGNRIVNVHPDSAQGGIAIWNGYGGNAYDITISENIVTNTQSGLGPGNGIRLYHHTSAGITSDIIITNNIVNSNSAYGLNINSNNLGDMKNLVINNNIFTDNSSGAFAYNSGQLKSSWNIGSNLGIDTLELTRNIGIGTLNPGEKLEVNGGVRLNTTTSKPTCEVAKRGTFWITQGATNIKDTVEVCAKDDSNAYAWRAIY